MKIEAYFSSIKRANEVIDKLKAAGFKNAFRDLNDHYIKNNNFGTNQPGTDIGAVNLSSYVLNTDESLHNPRLGPLLAASPMASGMGGFEEVADVKYRVIVTLEESNSEKVKKLLTSMGGDLKNPNYEIPKGLENIPTDEVVDKMLAEMDEDV